MSRFLGVSADDHWLLVDNGRESGQPEVRQVDTFVVMLFLAHSPSRNRFSEDEYRLNAPWFTTNHLFSLSTVIMLRLRITVAHHPVVYKDEVVAPSRSYHHFSSPTLGPEIRKLL